VGGWQAAPRVRVSLSQSEIHMGRAVMADLDRKGRKKKSNLQKNSGRSRRIRQEFEVGGEKTWIHHRTVVTSGKLV